MRKWLVLSVCFLQLVYLSAIALEREALLKYGETVVLRTAPVDPRDPFRGDYVVLRYDINAVSADALRGGAGRHRDQSGYPVFAALRPTSGSADVFELDYVSDQRPQRGPYIAGRTVQDWRLRAPEGGLAARYGIERLFVEQGHGLEIEQRRGQRGGLQVPMEVELSVSEHGEAAIRGFRWSPIGIQLETTREVPCPPGVRGCGGRDRGGRSRDGDPVAPELRLTLHNVGDEPRWLPAPGDHCAFRLASADWGAAEPEPADGRCRGVVASRADLVRLEPGETYSVTLDLAQPRWHVVIDGEARPIVDLEDFAARYRVLYRPQVEASLEVADGELWTSALPSPAFGARGMID